MIYHQTVSTSDYLLITLFLAGIVHVAIILGVNFQMPESQKETTRNLEIELVLTPTAKRPDKADYLAQENQVGGGKNVERATPQQVKIPASGNGRKLTQQLEKHQVRKVDNKKLLTQTKASHSVTKIVTDSQEIRSEQEKPKLSAAMLARQVAVLGTQIELEKEKQAKRPRIVYINALNAHKYMAASYENAWKRKVERVGNLNYPDEARRKDLTGKLLMTVGVNTDGSIYSLKIRRSSGHKALDDAAKRIVRLAAPFAPLPKELREETDVLVITRSWNFFNDQLLAATH